MKIKHRYKKNKNLLSLNKYNIFFNYTNNILSKELINTIIPGKSNYNIVRFYKSYHLPLKAFYGYISSKRLPTIESQLDVLVFRSHFAHSIFQARYLIKHGFITVNNNICTYPNFIVNSGSIIKSSHPLTASSNLVHARYNIFSIPKNIIKIKYNKILYI